MRKATKGSTVFNDNYDERESRMATESDAHAEWHRNSGVPMGTPGCPQDACHPDEHDEDDARCECEACEGTGKVPVRSSTNTGTPRVSLARCDKCRGKGKVVTPNA